MSPTLIVFIVCVFIVPSSHQHFFNDVDSGSSELCETDVSAEKSRPSAESRLEVDPESKTPKHVFESVGRHRRSVTSAFRTANNNAVNFLSQPHAGYTYSNPPLDSWNHNGIAKKPPSGEVFSYPRETLVAAKPKGVTGAQQNTNLHTFLSPQPNQGSGVFKTPEFGPESYVDRLFNDDQNVESPEPVQRGILSPLPTTGSKSHSDATIYEAPRVFQSPSELQSYFDAKNGHNFDFESKGFSKNNPSSILQPPVTTTQIAHHAQRPVIVSEQEFFGIPVQDFAEASHLSESPQNFKNGIHLISDSINVSEKVQNPAPQFYQEYSPSEKVLPDKHTDYLQSFQISSSSEEKSDDAVIQQLPLQKAKREKEHHTDVANQNDLGLATSLLHNEGLHGSIPHHPIEHETQKKVDDELTLKHYQSFHTSYNPYQNQAYQPYNFYYSRGHVGSDYGTNYQVNPGYKVVYKEEVDLPSPTPANEYDLYWGAVDNHKVSSHESFESEEKSEYFVGKPEIDNKYLRKKLLKKLLKKPKKSKCCGKKLGKKLKGKEVEDSDEDNSKKKPQKLRGFVRLLDAITRIVPDDIVDRIMNRSWDRLYRNHKNCWHYNDE